MQTGFLYVIEQKAFIGIYELDTTYNKFILYKYIDCRDGFLMYIGEHLDKHEIMYNKRYRYYYEFLLCSRTYYVDWYDLRFLKRLV